MAGLAGDCKAELRRWGHAQAQAQAANSALLPFFDLAQSLSTLTSLTVVKAAAAMSRGGLLLCLGGLDRTGNTAAIGADLLLAILGLPTLCERAQHCQKLALFWSACCANRYA
jgi:hypothetical protein